VSATPAALVLLVLAFVAANLPFLVERRFLILPPKRQFKSIGWRLMELIALYFIVGVVARLVERNMGTTQPQRWEFYAVTVCLFLVFAYPGYVYRYMWRKK
jgi:Na+(H+)/acetate symporter ActP